MPLRIRRIVTDHDQSGRAVVSADETCSGVSARPGHERCDLWKAPDGTVFRLVEYQPGVAPRNHRTETVDYAIVLSGEIEMDLDGTVVHLRKGDALVQRNTIHNWVNRGAQPCVIAFVLVPSKGGRGAVG
jgi:quercetin dioxygenase-like cupin family protein